MIEGLVIGCAFCFAFGVCVGMWLGIGIADRQHAKERKERREITEMVRAAGRKPVEIELTIGGIDEDKRRKEQFGDFVHAVMTMKESLDEMRGAK